MHGALKKPISVSPGIGVDRDARCRGDVGEPAGCPDHQPGPGHDRRCGKREHHFPGSGAHTLNGLSVLFTFKQLTASTSPVGPLTASLDPSRPSDGSLGSSTFPTTHKQN